MEFPDFPCDKSLIGFESHEEVLKYLKNYCDHFDLEQYIKFHHEIIHVRRSEDGERKSWIVTVRNLETQELIVRSYDGIFVCVGRYSLPNIPSIEGPERFDGRIIHSHDYRVNDAFRQQNVMILGAGPSGMDIAIEVALVARKVFLVHRKKTEYPNMPPNVIQMLSSIKSLERNLVLLENGTCLDDIHTIIWATGYDYDFHFLDSSVGISVLNDKKRVQDLYMHLINIQEPSMALFSIQQRILPFPIFHQQVLFFIKLLLGHIKLPSKDQMIRENEVEIQERISKGLSERQFHSMIQEFLWKYDDKLSRMAEIDPIPPVKRRIFDAIIGPREEMPQSYKEQKFSIINEDEYELISPKSN